MVKKYVEVSSNSTAGYNGWMQTSQESSEWCVRNGRPLRSELTMCSGEGKVEGQHTSTDFNSLVKLIINTSKTLREQFIANSREQFPSRRAPQPIVAILDMTFVQTVA